MSAKVSTEHHFLHAKSHFPPLSCSINIIYAGLEKACRGRRYTLAHSLRPHTGVHCVCEKERAEKGFNMSTPSGADFTAGVNKLALFKKLRVLSAPAEAGGARL